MSLDLEQAQRVVAGIVEREKTDAKNAAHPLRMEAVEQVHRIKAHADPSFYPEFLFKEAHPNETPEQQKYVRNNYKCTTNTTWQDFMSVVGRSFIDTNWNIIWPEGSDGLQEYCNEDFPTWGSLETFIKDVLPPVKLTDANAWLAVRPHGYAWLRDEAGKPILDEDQRPILDDTQAFEPAVYIHRSADIIIQEKEILVAVGSEKSPVTVGNKVKLEGRVLWIYTPNEIYRSEQYGEKSKNLYRTALWFEHGEGVMPVHQMRGVPYVKDDGRVFWISPFRYAVDLLDLALVNKNRMQISVGSVMFPFRVMMGSPCDFENEKGRCVSGTFMGIETGEKLGHCPSCRGTGTKMPYSPLGAYIWEKPEGLSGMTDRGTFPAKPVEFIAPDRSPLDFVNELIHTDTQSARSILHLQTSNSNVKGSEEMTATGSVLESGAQSAFIKPISAQLFDIMRWMYNRVAFQRYSGVVSDPYALVPAITDPTRFDFRTEADIWEQIKTAREAEAPAYVMHQLFYSLLNNLLSSDIEQQAVFETIAAADQLFALSDVQFQLAAPNAEPWRVTLHHRALPLVMELMREDSGYLELELTDRVERLRTLAESVTFAPTNRIDTVQQELLNGFT
jgi:hypothetical protein